MAQARKVIRPVFMVICIAVTGFGFYNVFGDNAEARGTAELTACGKHNCSVRLLENARNPISQTFEFQTGESARARVSCHRKFYFVGDWQCEREGGEPAPTPSASSSAK